MPRCHKKMPKPENDWKPLVIHETQNIVCCHVCLCCAMSSLNVQLTTKFFFCDRKESTNYCSISCSTSPLFAPGSGVSPRRSAASVDPRPSRQAHQKQSWKIYRLIFVTSELSLVFCPVFTPCFGRQKIWKLQPQKGTKLFCLSTAKFTPHIYKFMRHQLKKTI